MSKKKFRVRCYTPISDTPAKDFYVSCITDAVEMSRGELRIGYDVRITRTTKHEQENIR